MTKGNKKKTPLKTKTPGRKSNESNKVTIIQDNAPDELNRKRPSQRGRRSKGSASSISEHSGSKKSPPRLLRSHSKQQESKVTPKPRSAKMAKKILLAKAKGERTDDEDSDDDFSDENSDVANNETDDVSSVNSDGDDNGDDDGDDNGIASGSEEDSDNESKRDVKPRSSVARRDPNLKRRGDNDEAYKSDDSYVTESQRNKRKRSGGLKSGSASVKKQRTNSPFKPPTVDDPSRSPTKRRGAVTRVVVVNRTKEQKVQCAKDDTLQNQQMRHFERNRVRLLTKKIAQLEKELDDIAEEVDGLNEKVNVYRFKDVDLGSSYCTVQAKRARKASLIDHLNGCIFERSLKEIEIRDEIKLCKFQIKEAKQLVETITTTMSGNVKQYLSALNSTDNEDDKDHSS